MSTQPARRPQQARPDVDGIVARGAASPQHARPVGLTPQRGDRGHRVADDVARGVGEDGVRERVVERAALGVQRLEALAVARQRPPPARTLPRDNRIDVEQHDDVALERVTHARRADRPAAERDRRAWRRGEQLAHDLLLQRAERGFAMRGEVVLDRPPETLLDDRVGVDGPAAERRRRRTGGGRLAGAHEADEDERRLV